MRSNFYTRATGGEIVHYLFHVALQKFDDQYFELSESHHDVPQSSIGFTGRPHPQGNGICVKTLVKKASNKRGDHVTFIYVLLVSTVSAESSQLYN